MSTVTPNSNLQELIEFVCEHNRFDAESHPEIARAPDAATRERLVTEHLIDHLQVALRGLSEYSLRTSHGKHVVRGPMREGVILMLMHAMQLADHLGFSGDGIASELRLLVQHPKHPISGQ